MKGLRHMLQSIGQLEKQSTCYVRVGLEKRCCKSYWMVMLEVIKTRIVFIFELANLEGWMVIRLRLLLLEVEGREALWGPLRISAWKVTGFPYGIRSEQSMMEWGKPGGPFRGYRQ